MRKLFLLLLLGSAVAAGPAKAWALPWEGWVTLSHDHTQELRLGRTVTFNYMYINTITPPEYSGQAFDVLAVQAGDTFVGQTSEYYSIYPTWKSVTLNVPESVLFTTQTLRFLTRDYGPRTDPRWVLNSVSSPIPEPATLLLFGGGLLGLAGFRKKKKA